MDIDFDIDIPEIDFDIEFNGNQESEPEIEILKRPNKHITKMITMCRESLVKHLTCLPESQETWHIILRGAFDFYTFVKILIEHLEIVDEMYITTLAINRNTIIRLFHDYDNGLIKKISIVTSDMYKRMNDNWLLLQGKMKVRGERVANVKNHSKITLMQGSNHQHIAICGSANYSTNPYIENITVDNDKHLYDFHKKWIEKELNR